MKTISGRVAVVTGAASGIGAATARLLADKGAELALSDVDEAGLSAVVESIASSGATVRGYPLDVSKREAVYQHAEDVMRDFGRVHIVINNAGVALGATVEEMEISELEWLMGINFWGVVYGTKAFLPHLKRAQEGHIVNISSVFGLIAVPTQSAYNAAKFAVRGFTEALRQELELEGANVSCTCVHPGGIKTRIAENGRLGANVPGDAPSIRAQAAVDFAKMAKTTPEQAAQVIVAALLHNRRRALIGADAYFIDGLQRLLPTAYQAIVRKVASRSKAMATRRKHV